jgi:hypothetical protein
MKRETWNVLKAFVVEFIVYAVLVTAYFLLVLRFLGDLLLRLFQEEDRTAYAVVALLLIIGQGFVLEILTRTLLRVFRGKGEKK